MSHIDVETKEQARQIIFDAMLMTQAAMNSMLAIHELCDSDNTFVASDSCAQALRQLNYALRQLGKIPTGAE